MDVLCKLGKDYGPLIGRILLALIFVISGFNKINGFAQTAGYMASKGLPMSDVLLVITILIEVGGGLMLIIGWQARWAALALILFVIPATLVFHNFWAVPEAQKMTQWIMFMKNLSIMGGLLLVVGFGAGPYSLGKDKC